MLVGVDYWGLHPNLRQVSWAWNLLWRDIVKSCAARGGTTMTVTRLASSTPSRRGARALSTSPSSAPRSDSAAADEVDWTDWADSDGERYVSLPIDEDWPGPQGAAAHGIP
jgi:hypothetical protein